MKHKKTLVAILLCTVLIFGMFALVACGETDDENDNTPTSEIVDFIEHAIGYGQTSYYYFTIGGSIVKDGYMLDEGQICTITAEFFTQNDSNPNICYFDLYNSEAEATAGMSTQGNDRPNRYQIGNLLISENKEGLYNEIISSSPETQLATSAMIAFTKESISNSLSLDNVADFAFLSNTKQAQFTLYGCPVTDDYEECYFCAYGENTEEALQEYAEEFKSKIGTEYSSDSYVKIENGVLFSYYKQTRS